MVIICVIASNKVGLGHFFRAINIGNLLFQNSIDYRILVIGAISFPIESFSKQNEKFILCNEGMLNIDGWETKFVSKYKPKIWINDRLQTSETHINFLKSFGIRVISIDDFSPSSASADLHIAPLQGLISPSKYMPNTVTGLEYLLLNPLIQASRRLRKTFKKVILSLGGSDTYSVTQRLLRSLVDTEYQVTVVTGPETQLQISEMKLSDNVVLKTNVNCLVTEMSKHDFAITNGGITAFEAVALGLPTNIIANESWETAYGRYLESAGCANFCGYHLDLQFSVPLQLKYSEAMSEKCLLLSESIGSKFNIQLISGKEV